MNKLMTLAVVIISAVPLFARQETVLKGDVDYGGYIGPVAKYTAINGGYGVLPGDAGD